MMRLLDGALDGGGARLLWYEVRIFYVEESGGVPATVSLAMAAATASPPLAQLAQDGRAPSQRTFFW
jgi:hypothetical protein